MEIKPPVSRKSGEEQVLTPWRSLSQPDPGRQYVALLTALGLQRARDVPLLFWHTWRIWGQLRKSRGLVGYSLRAELLSQRFWTLSAWEDELTLQAFVRTLPHVRIMKVMAPRTRANSFLRWTILGADLPPRWDDALARARA